MKNACFLFGLFLNEPPGFGVFWRLVGGKWKSIVIYCLGFFWNPRVGGLFDLELVLGTIWMLVGMLVGGKEFSAAGKAFSWFGLNPSVTWC